MPRKLRWPILRSTEKRSEATLAGPIPRKSSSLSPIAIKPSLTPFFFPSRSRFTAVVVLVLSSWPLLAQTPPAAGEPWYTTSDGEPRVVLHFFWTEHCAHCVRARPFVAGLGARYPWLEVRDFEITAHADHTRHYIRLARSLGEEARSVPAFLFCEEMITGFDNASGVGAHLEERLRACYRAAAEAAPAEPALPRPAPLPVLGQVDLTAWSLPALAITLGALDSFNPCAFFVLLFLLSLLVHARSRRRMLLVGGLFVMVSGIVYFVFMTAWLNLFILVGQLPWMTLAAGVVAMLMGLVNVKDYLAFGRGPSLSIPEAARPGLFARMRALVSADRPGPLVAGTLALAVAVNAYELLCTAGFPMVFTRVLTLHELSTASYYFYLALYTTVYVLPLLVIVLLFVASLGRRRLTEREGRTLKLLSGVMMLGLGVMLVTAPQLLGNALVAAGLLVAALGITAAVRRWLPA
jgi:hypothetical protein